RDATHRRFLPIAPWPSKRECSLCGPGSISKSGHRPRSRRRDGIGSVIRSGTASMNIDAEGRGPAATAQLVRFHLAAPADDDIRIEHAYQLDLCLTPRMRN